MRAPIVSLGLFLSACAVPPRDGVEFRLRAPQARQVFVAGDFTGWQDAPIPMVKDGDVHRLELTVHPAARLEYQFIVDGKWIADPGNPRTIDSGVGTVNSWIGMPGYAPPAPPKPVRPRGALRETKVGGHAVWVYLPAGYAESTERFPVQYFQDGKEYLERGRSLDVLDALAIRLIGVFVAPVDRAREYSCGEEYSKFFVEELVPWVDREYRTLPNRGLIGDSLGGLISVHLAYRAPELFGRVASQSGAFYTERTKIYDRIRAAKTHPSRLYLSVGIYESLVHQHAELLPILEERKVPHRYRERPYGHNWTFWKEELPEALRFLWE